MTGRRAQLGLVALLAGALPVRPAAAQDYDDERGLPPGKFGIEGYGVVNYFHFTWQTDPNRRHALDLERLAIEPSYQVNKRLRLTAELEFEHGGTGATLEFDPFEEFGEFEQEIEKGGEIVIERLEAMFELQPAFNVRAGRIYVPVGLISAHYEPDEYFTNTRNESEAAMIPALWHETGIGVFGTLGRLRYQTMLVSGLDATGFSSANWVQRGFQQRFETVNANNLAVVGRLDLGMGGDSYVGVSGYFGNSSGNRPKADLSVPAYVTILDAHAVMERGPLTARALVLYGHLQNSAAVSAANRNLSNNLNVKRTPVASSSLAWFGEIGYDLLSLARGPAGPADPRLDAFVRYDWYDTMFRVEEGIFDNPRWERHVVTAGLNWRLVRGFVVKGQYSHRTVGLATANREDTIALGFGFTFGH